MLFNLQITAVYILAIVTAVCGTWVLQTAWRSPHRKWHLVLAGWLIVLLSFYVWTFTTAADKGIALGITAWVVITLLFLLRAAMELPVRVERQNRTHKAKTKEVVASKVSKPQIALNILTVFMIGPLAGLVAMLMSTLLLILMQALRVEYTANLALASILFPVFWAGLAVVLGYQQRLPARLLTVTGIGFGSLLCLWLAS